MTEIRVVIAEDHFLLREGTRQLLEDSGRVQVVACVDNVPDLLRAVDRLRPAVVVTDIRLPPGFAMEGIEAAHTIRAMGSGIGVVVLSQYANALYAFELFRDGVEGLAYLLKERVGDVDQLLHGIAAVANGGSVVDPLVLEGLIGRSGRRVAGALDPLTPREYDVLKLMAEGRSNAGIARELDISESGVEKHVNAVLGKLGLDAADTAVNRRVAAVLAFLGGHGTGAPR